MGDKENPGALTAKEFKDTLMNEGEKLTQEEFDMCVEVLMGEDNYLPEMVNSQNLFEDILALEDEGEEYDEEDYEGSDYDEEDEE